MNYLDELKKYKNNFVQTAQNVGNAVQSGVKELYNTGQQAVQNVQNAVKGNAQPEYDMAAQYDNYKAEQQAQRAATQQAHQQAQPTATPQASQQQTGQQTQSQWQSQLDNIMNQIMNREKFSYDMNGDALYQQYADIYQNQANLGMQNAMAQAAALTGGYGSSYSQQVGQQAYAQQMQGLNEVGMDLYNQALNQYMMEGDQLARQYEMLAAREQDAYNRGIDERNFEYQQGRDQVIDNQWQAELDRYLANDKLAAEQWDKSFEYQQGRDQVYDSQWKAELDRMLANDEISREQWQAEMDRATANDQTAKEQWDKQFASSEEQRAYENAYNDAVFEYQQERDAVSDSQWRAELDRMLANDEISREQWQAEMDRYLANDQTAKEQWQAEFDQSDKQFDKLYGEEGYYRTEADADRQHDKDMQKDAQDYADAEWERMYGKNGYYTKKDAADAKAEADQFDKLYGEDGYYNTSREDEQEFQREMQGYSEGSKITTYEGGGMLDGQKVPTALAGVTGLTTTNTDLFDNNGKFKTAIATTTMKLNEVSGKYEPATGNNVTWNIGGKTETLPVGINPYTRTENIDTEYGTFENGYQPNNVASYYGDPEMGKLTKTKQTDVVNGVSQPIYEDGVGKRWIWDDVTNEYMEYAGDMGQSSGGSVNDKQNITANPILRR